MEKNLDEICLIKEVFLLEKEEYEEGKVDVEVLLRYLETGCNRCDGLNRNCKNYYNTLEPKKN